MIAETLAPIDYAIRRSARARRSRIVIEQDAAVIVVLPTRAPAREAAQLIDMHGAWIQRHVARITARRRALALRPSLAHGRLLTINGQPEIVRAVTAVERGALERRLRRAARAAIQERVAARALEIGAAVRRITIRDQKTRWGSASRTGTLSFSWRLILAPPDVLDYVVVHELAHLRVAGHGPGFWRLVKRHFADPAAARKWLRAHHDEIRSALD